MSGLEEITRENYRNRLGLFSSLFIGGLLTYFSVVKANPIIANSDCYFGTATQNIIGDSLQGIEAKIRNVTQNEEDIDTTDVNGYFNICTVGIDEKDISKSVTFGIRNYPNPFSNRMTFDLKIPEESKGKVSLSIYDISGRLVRTLVDANLDAGNYQYLWDGRDNNDREVSNGNYYYRITANNQTETDKIVFIKSGNSSSNLLINNKSKIIHPNEAKLTSVLPDSLIFSLVDTLRFYSWREANPAVGENNRIMITLDKDSLTDRDKLEHLKYGFGVLDTDFWFNENKLVRWEDQDIPIIVYSNPTAAVPYDTLVPILIAQATSNWENKSGLDSLFTVNNDSLPGGIGITFEYPDSIPGANGVTIIDQWASNPLRPKHVTIQIDKVHLARYDSFPDAVLATFGHELGHALIIGRHGLSTNEIMYPIPWVYQPSRQEGQIVREVYTLLKPGDLMGPYRYRGDLNPGPTSTSVDLEKLLSEFPPDLEKLVKYLPEDLKFKNLPKK